MIIRYVTLIIIILLQSTYSLADNQITYKDIASILAKLEGNDLQILLNSKKFGDVVKAVGYIEQAQKLDRFCIDFFHILKDLQIDSQNNSIYALLIIKNPAQLMTTIQTSKRKINLSFKGSLHVKINFEGEATKQIISMSFKDRMILTNKAGEKLKLLSGSQIILRSVNMFEISEALVEIDKLYLTSVNVCKESNTFGKIYLDSDEKGIHISNNTLLSIKAGRLFANIQQNLVYNKESQYIEKNFKLITK